MTQSPPESQSPASNTPICLGAVGALCGESPVWDHRAGCLRWIDITAQRVHAYDPATETTTTLTLPYLVSSVLLEHGGGLLVTTARGLERLDLTTGQLEFLHNPEPDLPGNRLNDCKADPSGHLCAGTMSEGAKGPTGALYQYGSNGPERLVSGLTVSNGLGWSPDARHFYLVDSAKGEINAFDRDPQSGALSARRLLASYPLDQGKPDGLCVDQDGNLWVAFWDGARVECLSPDGALRHVVPLPVRRPTSCCFGGPDLKRLYITSAAIGLDAPDLDGGLFALDLDVAGLPTNEVRLGPLTDL
ncbi:SMP-30/gluconolactonase/LRE family protein [Marinovum sp. 2_MG-2023]|uniref:SMP-30/gluconolactonase/LRE family protein n=1 Tax=unclassified Marinovum TaxID=2647166 RepID=UPI0026E3697B|nr:MULTISPECIES: SMP-30/gluconolactonase/LRE family protein [unclassified Marinovum]MDO6732940.1 SMP-30/gluconolactonase/LRE family protein [Marinovum sp. 2_MG-2023]MDO6782218.1 SMP-30/gluconolactonase/LRE family protein [Marinovum sp. 1_MG-2023]